MDHTMFYGTCSKSPWNTKNLTLPLCQCHTATIAGVYSSRGRKETMTNNGSPLKNVLSAPPVKLQLFKALPKIGVAVVLGCRGEGKTALALRIMESYHKRYGMGGDFLYFPRSLARALPKWVKRSNSKEKMSFNSVCIVDEAAQEAHSRRSQSAENIEMEELVGLSRQRKQLILYLTHHSRKLDLNLIIDSDVLLYKRPSEAHYLFERSEVQPITRKVLDEFNAKVPPRAKSQPWTFVINLHHLQLGWMQNPLPSFWADRLSTWVGLVGKEKAKKG